MRFQLTDLLTLWIYSVSLFPFERVATLPHRLRFHRFLCFLAEWRLHSMQARHLAGIFYTRRSSWRAFNWCYIIGNLLLIQRGLRLKFPSRQAFCRTKEWNGTHRLSQAIKMIDYHTTMIPRFIRATIELCVVCVCARFVLVFLLVWFTSAYGLFIYNYSGTKRLPAFNSIN